MYARLDTQEQFYLDYTGAGLYAECQMLPHLKLFSRHVFGNPHSTNPASQAMTELVERARPFVLSYFHASPQEYVVIFTSMPVMPSSWSENPTPFCPRRAVSVIVLTQPTLAKFEIEEERAFDEIFQINF